GRINTDLYRIILELTERASTSRSRALNAQSGALTSWRKPPMLKCPVRKCRCPLGDHGHKPRKCNNLATEHDQLCKPCLDRQAKELRLIGVTSGRDAKQPSR